MKPSSLLVAAILASAASADHVLWNPSNCVDGTVTDFVCCKDNHCQQRSSTACRRDDTCLWDADQDRCTENRDALNNVCCKANVSPDCTAIAKGECPAHFQVTFAI